MVLDYNNMDVYRDLWRVRLATGSAGLLHNSSVEHACALIAGLLNFACKEVWIYCLHLGADVWEKDDVMDALKQAIAKGVRINVVVQHRHSDGNRALACLYAANVVVRQTGVAFKPNFVVVDGKAFRFEEDPEKRQGVACANDPQTATALIEAFNSLRENSTVVEVKKAS